MSIEAAQYYEDSEKLYHGVFEFSNSVWNYDRIVDAMQKLVADQYALATDDPRRAQVEYWIEAGKEDVSKCTFEAHRVMMAHLESDRSKAEEKKRGLPYPSDQDVIFNLENYVGKVKSRRFIYCLTTVGYSFTQSFDKAISGDSKDLDNLTANLDWLSDKDPKKIGKRVAKLLRRKLDSASFVQVSKNADSIKDHFDQVSPCVKVLNVIQEHDSYYRLLTVPGNYEKCTLYLSNCLDKISVCEFIQNSRRVFEYAADYMSKMSR